MRIGPQENCDRKKKDNEKGVQDARKLLHAKTFCGDSRACPPLGYENCGGAPRSKMPVQEEELKNGRMLSSGRWSRQIQLRLRTQMGQELLF